MLQAAFPTAPVSRHDGELIDDLLPLSIRPTAVLINPPFSRSIGRHADPLAAFRHLRAALKRLDAGGRCAAILPDRVDRSEEHTSELQSLMRISYAVFCLKKKTKFVILHSEFLMQRVTSTVNNKPTYINICSCL